MLQKKILTLLWEPGHTGVPGNRKTDELAKYGGALETGGPHPSQPISHNVVRTLLRTWALYQTKDKLSKTDKCKTSKVFLSPTDSNFTQQLLRLRKPNLPYTINTKTGQN